MFWMIDSGICCMSVEVLGGYCFVYTTLKISPQGEVAGVKRSIGKGEFW